MNIKLIKLRDGGFKGIELHHFVDRVRNNKILPTLEKLYPKDPVHKDLQNLFADLRESLLSACGYLDGGNDEVVKYLILETEVTGIEFDSGTFKIHGKKRVFHDKFVTLNTCEIEEIDNFDKYEFVKETITKIVEEVRLYVDGSKKVTDQELVINWIESGKEKDLDVEKYNSMSAEEQREYFTMILETKFGSIVTHNEDLDLSTIEDISEEQLLLPQSVGESIVIDITPKEKVKKEKKVESKEDEVF